MSNPKFNAYMRERMDFGRVYPRRKQFEGEITPPDKIHAQSTGRHDLKPEQPRNLRRQPKPKMPPGPVLKNSAPAEVARPRAKPIAPVNREIPSIVLW